MKNERILDIIRPFFDRSLLVVIFDLFHMLAVLALFTIYTIIIGVFVWGHLINAWKYFWSFF